MRKLWKNHKGVTMIEVLVTVAILAIVVAPCLSAFVMAQRGNVRAAEVTNTYTAASNLMEELKGGMHTLSGDVGEFTKITGDDNLVTAFCENKGGYYFVTIYAGTFEADEDPSEGTEPILEGVIVR